MSFTEEWQPAHTELSLAEKYSNLADEKRRKKHPRNRNATLNSNQYFTEYGTV